MAKGQTKSSASSATRKKHARKAAGGAEQALPLPKEKKPKDKAGKGKGKKEKEPRVKMYIRPSKPVPVRLDPLDSLGLANQLPPDLLVALRRLSKKDAVTKRKAIEDIRDDWVETILRGDDANEGGVKESALELAMPVWLHHLPTLLLHASRQIRASSASLHASLLRIDSIRSHIQNFVDENGETSQGELLIGSWSLSMHDTDRQTSSFARRAWQLAFPALSTSSSLFLIPALVTSLLHFVQNTLLDPLALYQEVNPTQPAFVPPPLPRTQPRGKGDIGAKHGTSTPATKPHNDGDVTPRRTEDEEESEDDRKARLRIGALGVLKWIIEQPSSVTSGPILDILGTPLIWTSLYHGLAAPFLPKQSDWPSVHLGAHQPAVRRSAWSMLLSLLKCRKDDLEKINSILSSAVLRSAWVEPDALVRGVMWEPLLVFLMQNPKAWEIDISNQGENSLSSPDRSGAHDDDDGDSEGSDSGEEEDNSYEEPKAAHGEDTAPSSTSAFNSQAYSEFLQFLQLGCSGSPVQGYPTVVVILSTIPPSILGKQPEDWQDFLTSFWAALDGRALSSLDRSASGTAFLCALLECTVFLVKRSLASCQADERGSMSELLKVTSSEQVGHAWEEIVSGKLRVNCNAAGTAIARTVGSFEGINESFFDAVWAPINTSFLSLSLPENSRLPTLNTRIILLKTILDHVKGETKASLAIHDCVRQTTSNLLQRCTEDLTTRSPITEGTRTDEKSLLGVLEILKEMFDCFGPLIFGDSTLSERVDNILQSNMPSVLISGGGPGLLLSYFTSQTFHVNATNLWHSVLHNLSSNTQAQESALPVLLEGAGKGTLPPYLLPGEDDISEFMGRVVASLYDDGTRTDRVKLDIAKRMFENPSPFLSRQMTLTLIHKLLYGFSEKSRQLICPRISPVSHASVLDQFAAVATPLELILNTLKAHPEMMQATDGREFLSDIFVFAFVLSRAIPGVVDICGESLGRATRIWELGTESLQPEDMARLLEHIKTVLRDLVSDVDCLASPTVILDSVTQDLPGTSASGDILKELFPSEEILDEMLKISPTNPPHPALAVVDPLVPPLSQRGESASTSGVTYDVDGYSEYARIVNAMLEFVSRDRFLARKNVWLLQHFLILERSASDFLMLSGEPSPFFRKNVSETLLMGIIERVQSLTAFLISDVGDANWHRSVVGSLTNPGSSSSNGAIGDFINSLLAKSRQHDTVQNSRLFYTVMKHVLSDADRVDAEHWMTLGRGLERNSPHASLALVHAITESGLEPPSLDRYRNEQAAGILGIPPSKANTNGLSLLRRLAVSAPDPESEIVFLPPNRAVNFMKACQTWLSSDEDIDEDVESEMTGVFVHLAPILQNVPGSHWELIFDVLESNLESISSLETTNLPILSRSLKLLSTIQDLSTTNKSLRADWKERELTVLKLVRDFVQNASSKGTQASYESEESDTVSSVGERPSVSIPRQICWELAFGIIGNLPPSLVDHNTISNMAHLLTDPSPELAKMAYALLQDAAAKRTEYLVVEAGVDNSEDAKFELPVELLQILQDSPFGDDIQPNVSQNMFSYLLGWMLVFDLFVGASLRVKMGYASQLRELGLFSNNFLPNVLGLLNVYDGRGRPFPLEYWKVDEYYVQLYDVDSELSPKLLAAHLYYRALLNVPSLIASWWGECKDRQLSNAIAAFTIKYYSPVLIAAELRHVKDPAGVDELTGENWGIKVSAGAGEVTAAYTVDDQDMEIAVRLPPDYPIHSIEVREVHRLGVDEKKWRGWLLAVQQVITSQNGRIVDGLSIFKKNVTHHFENQTECAICYSIISVTELSLPKKRCKTCRNRFHAGCLFKWFNTSHTSSCPLCRSDFI